MLGQCGELLPVLLRAKGDKLGLRLDHCRAAWTAVPFLLGRLARERGDIELVTRLRIAAGAIVLTGVLLAQFVNPAFIWLSGFVGAGLIFAGITDWCGMGMLIAKLPWNQRGSDAGCAK